jgi:uncharacterized protein YraI
MRLRHIVRQDAGKWLLALAFSLWALVLFVQAQDTPDAQVMAETSLRLRAAPTTESDILRLLDAETPLTVLGVSPQQDWLNVRVPDGALGWVSAEYVDVFIDLNTLFPPAPGDVRLSADVIAHIQQVYIRGQELGNNANVFAKVGDSITVSSLTLHPVGVGLYNLADYAYLQGVIDFYTAGKTRDERNSFNEESVAAGIGWTTYAVLDPEASDAEQCLPGEIPLLCEYRLLRPSVALIMYGTNDIGVVESRQYRANLDRIVTLTEALGIIPVLTTVPTRVDYEERTREFNQIVTEVALVHQIPLLDYGGAMQPLGLAGFDLDQVHPSPPPLGYEGAADFSEGNLGYGYVVRNLTALQILDAVWRATAA